MRFIIASLLLALSTPVLAAEATQGPPDFGIDTSGTLRNLSVRDATLGSRVPLAILNTTTHSFVAATTPVESYGALGNSNGTTGNGADDTAAFTACAASGKVCALRPGATYRIMSRVDVGNNSGFVGTRTSTIYADPAGFTHASTSGTNRWITGVVLRAQGNSSPTYIPYNSVKFEGFRLLLGAGDDTTDGRYIIGIGIRNFLWAEVRGVEITGGTSGAAIHVDDVQGIIADNYIHDFYDNRNWNPEQPQMLGVWVDGDAFVPEPNNGSNNLRITGNVIQRMMVGSAQYADSHWQPDGIGIASKNSRNIEVDNNDISYVGKAIWVLGGTYINIHNNRVSYSFNQAISCATGCQNSTIADNIIYAAGAASIATAGSSGSPPRNTTNNVIRDNYAVRVGDTDWSVFGAGRFTGSACYMTGSDFSFGYTYIDTGNKWINNFCDPDTTGAGTNTYSFWRYGGPLQSNDWYGNVGKKGNSGVVNNPYGEKGEYTSAQGENPPVELYGAKGDSNGTTGNGTDDTAAIEACVAGGRVCSLRPGATYRLMSAIDIPSNGGLIGDKSAMLYCDPAGISNTDATAGGGRYAESASCIQVEGPFQDQGVGAIANVVLKDFKINWGGSGPGPVASRCCQAIEARNTKNMLIDGLEIYNGSANGIRFASWQSGKITNNYIHDFTNNNGQEYSGIEGDNDINSGKASTDVEIASNRIISMRVSEAGYNNTLTDPLLPDGYQPNAIKVVNDPKRLIVRNNYLQYSGQAIDLYSDDSVIEGNTMDHHGGCISLKHSFERNIVANNFMSHCSYWGVGLGGDSVAVAKDNLIIGNVVKDVQVNDWAAVGWSNPNLFQTALDAPGTDGSCLSENLSAGNFFIGNYCDPGTHGEFMWRPQTSTINTPETPSYWIGNSGKPGISATNGGHWYANGNYAVNNVTDDMDIRAYKPWVDVTATSDTPLVGSNLINVVGPNINIQDFIYGTRGATFILKFNGAYILRCAVWSDVPVPGNNGNLICPNGGGTPLTTAPGDMMGLVVENPMSARSGGGGNGGIYRIMWYRKGDGTPLVIAGTNTNAADAAIRLYRTNTGADVIPIGIGNLAGADGSAALMDLSATNQFNIRSVQIGDIDKPTTTAHCFTVRTSNGTVPVERTFTCLGTVVGAPAGGTNGDMGVGTLNATGIYQNGVALAPAAVSTPAPTLTFGGASTGVAMGTGARSITRDKQVFFQWQVILTNKGSAAGAALLDGLPVAAVTGMFIPCTVAVTNMTAGVGDTALSCRIAGGSTTVVLYKAVAGVATQLTDADFTNVSQVYVSGTYITN